jgi:predicted GTPase
MWSIKQTEIVINVDAQIINSASGSDLTVGEGLKSCTYDVNVALDFELDGRVVKLIDTPGFDDTNRSDTDILAAIAGHLEKACVVLLRLIHIGLLGD